MQTTAKPWSFTPACTVLRPVYAFETLLFSTEGLDVIYFGTLEYDCESLSSICVGTHCYWSWPEELLVQRALLKSRK
ncbi:hypothetical protein VKT23_007856 [Stygiomarasmius scandens]|uniref:Uncharacterized protein n=1 Tax=Marasmiellus scandens TaxID=2682957 RepID=A0ABR1JIL4_9AGAR